jgi:hypothetical protein
LDQSSCRLLRSLRFGFSQALDKISLSGFYGGIYWRSLLRRDSLTPTCPYPASTTLQPEPVVLGTFSATIKVAAALPVGTTRGYPTGQLYVVDGSIYYVNYATPAGYAALFTIPG